MHCKSYLRLLNSTVILQEVPGITRVLGLAGTYMRSLPLRKLLIGELSWKRLVRSVLFIYTFFALYVFFRTNSMIFLPQPATYQNTKDILKIPVAGTQKISAIYLPNAQAAYTLLYIHGNAEDLGDVRPVFDRLYNWEFSVCL